MSKVAVSQSLTVPNLLMEKALQFSECFLSNDLLSASAIAFDMQILWK